jgi:hypothetical protein
MGYTIFTVNDVLAQFCGDDVWYMLMLGDRIDLLLCELA